MLFRNKRAVQQGNRMQNGIQREGLRVTLQTYETGEIQLFSFLEETRNFPQFSQT